VSLVAAQPDDRAGADVIECGAQRRLTGRDLGHSIAGHQDNGDARRRDVLLRRQVPIGPQQDLETVRDGTLELSPA